MVAIQSVSADPDDLDDFPVTHHTTGHSAGELQHVHTFHFDNLLYLHTDKTISFGNFYLNMKFTAQLLYAESRFSASVWQPPKNS